MESNLKERQEVFDFPVLRVIHVWTASLSASPKDLDRYRAVLSADELERAAQFRFDIHRDRFVTGRGILRSLLSRYTRQDPATIELSYGRHGKPSICDCDLHFNLAHSQDRAVLAFTTIAPVGVDMECFRPIADMMPIGESFFSSLEFKTMSVIPDAQRTTAFLRCWTRKEAVIKATGDGLSVRLDDFNVSFGATAQVVKCIGAKQEFFLYNLELPEGDVGAVACLRSCDKIVLLRYTS